MRVIVTGSRFWSTDEQIYKIYDELVKLPAGSRIVHGACKGVDTIAWAIALLLNYDVKTYPANWSLHGRSAGPIRNREMLASELPVDLVLAFHDDIENSKGTRDMINVARSAGIKHKIVC